MWKILEVNKQMYVKPLKMGTHGRKRERERDYESGRIIKEIEMK